MIKIRIHKILHWDYFPMLFFAFLILIIHFFSGPSGDDIPYGTVYYHEPVLTFIYESYFQWSSRIIIMPIAAFFAGNPFWLFSIFNVAIYFLLAFMISKLFVYDNKLKMNWIIVLLLFTVPFVTMMTTAGWVVTSVHYLWPFAFSLVALYPVKKFYFNEAIKWFEYPVYLVASFFGMNMEIMAAILMTLYIVFAIYFIVKNKLSFYVIFMVLILIINFAFIFFCPGNGVREASEIVTNFPEYASFGFFQKTAVSATSHVFSIDQNFSMLAVFGLAWFYSWQKYKTWISRIIGISPFVFCVIINMVRLIVSSDKFEYLFLGLTGKSISTWVTISGITNGYLGFYHYLVLIFMTAFVLALMAMTLLLFKDSKKLGVAVLTVGASIMSRVVMGFSPTVYESGARTFLFQYIGMIIFGLLMYQEFNLSLTSKNQKRVVCFLIFMTILGYLESFLKLI